MKHVTIYICYNVCYNGGGDRMLDVETIVKAGTALGLGKYTFLCHPRYVMENEYYCRAANSVIPAHSLRKCRFCPLLGGYTQGEQSGQPICCYYDFHAGDGNFYTPHAEKERIDALIEQCGVPEFPHFIRPGEPGKLVEKALQYAAVAHKGAKRKGSDLPYIFHPIEAALIAWGLTDDEEVVAGAALHDVVEDTVYTVDDIRAVFGDKVAALVASESEDKRRDIAPEHSWQTRKEEALEQLKHASRNVKLISLSDKLSNMRDMKFDFDEIKDELWERFNQRDPAAHAWYYRSVRDICKADFKETPAWQEYARLIDEVFEKY